MRSQKARSVAPADQPLSFDNAASGQVDQRILWTEPTRSPVTTTMSPASRHYSLSACRSMRADNCTSLPTTLAPINSNLLVQARIR
jgi:hypothetical protein